MLLKLIKLCELIGHCIHKRRTNWPLHTQTSQKRPSRGVKVGHDLLLPGQHALQQNAIAYHKGKCRVHVAHVSAIAKLMQGACATHQCKCKCTLHAHAIASYELHAVCRLPFAVASNVAALPHCTGQCATKSGHGRPTLREGRGNEQRTGESSEEKEGETKTIPKLGHRWLRWRCRSLPGPERSPALAWTERTWPLH